MPIITVEVLLKDDPAIGKLTKAKLLEKLAKEMDYATRLREDYDRSQMKLWHAQKEIDELKAVNCEKTTAFKKLDKYHHALIDKYIAQEKEIDELDRKLEQAIYDKESALMASLSK
jgi:hypothetical protein